MLDKILLHPIALLGFLKKYSIFSEEKKNIRIIGSLLGYQKKKKISCTSSFRIPFENETEENSWFLDHNFVEKMADMYKKVNSKETVIGWFTESKQLNKKDINISKVFVGYSNIPVTILFWQKNKNKGLFIQAFFMKNYILDNNPIFSMVPVTIGMLESEEIGIFQILKNSTHIKNAILTNSIKRCFKIVVSYIENVKKLNKIGHFSYSTSQKYNLELEKFQKSLEKSNKKLNCKNFEKKTKKNYLYWYISILIQIFSILEEKYIKLINFEKLKKNIYQNIFKSA